MAAVGYRGTKSQLIQSSGSEDSSSEDEDGTWKRKRCRQSGIDEMDASEEFNNPLSLRSSGHMGGQSVRRNNVWGDVVSEQTVNQDLLSFGVDGEAEIAHTVSRDVESYKVSKDMLELVNRDKDDDSNGEMEEDGKKDAKEDSDKDDIFETKIFGKKSVKDRLGCPKSSRQYRDMDNVGSDDEDREKGKMQRGWRKRQRTSDKNEDFSSLLQRYQKEREEIKVGEKRKRDRLKRFEKKEQDVDMGDSMDTKDKITADDTPEVVLKHVMKGLEEDNMKLFSLILEVIGNTKMLDIYTKTLDVEDVGGMMTLDGSRRRTPGGVFIQMLKSDKDISKEQLNIMFEESNMNWRREKKQAKKSRKKKREYEQVKEGMMMPGMEDVYRKLLDDQLSSLKNKAKKAQKDNQAENMQDMEADDGGVKEESLGQMESDANVVVSVTPPPSPEEGSEEGEILD